MLKHKRKKNNGIIVVCGLAVLALFAFALTSITGTFLKTNIGATSPTLSITPVTQEVKKGDTVVITLDVSNVVDLFGFQTDISYDPAVLSYVSTTEGPFLQQGDPASTFFQVPKTPQPGTLEYLYSLRKSLPSVNGNGTLATITFTALKEGTSAINISNAILSNSVPEAIPNVVTVNGSVVVKSSNPVRPPLSGPPPAGVKLYTHGSFETAGIILTLAPGNNGNETATIEVMGPTEFEYRQAYPFTRYDGNNMATSLFYLAPASTYDLRITLNDPDGLGTAVFGGQVTTRPEFTVPAPVRSITVGTNPELQAALTAAQPGDEIIIKPGTYAKFALTDKVATEQSPIVIRAADPASRPIIDGGGSGDTVYLNNDAYVYIDGLETINTGSSNAGVMVRASSHVVVQNSFVHGKGMYGILFNKGAQFPGGVELGGYHIAQNNEVANGKHGIMVDNNPGGGTVIRNNTLHDLYDGIKMCQNEDVARSLPENTAHVLTFTGAGGTMTNHDTEVYDNTMTDFGDDNIELDGVCVNGRVFRNMFGNATNAISATDVAPGPVFVIRNVVSGKMDFGTGTGQALFKLNTAGSSSIPERNVYVYHNTMIRTNPGRLINLWYADSGQGHNVPLKNYVFKNNIILHQSTGAIQNCKNADAVENPTYDYNTWFGTPSVGGFCWKTSSGIVKYDTFDAWRAGSAQETNGLFQDPKLDASYKPADSTSPVIDRAVMIPGINDTFVGAGPDIGAFEFGTVITPKQCGDGLDNDTDGLTDYPNDPGCTSAVDDDETNVPVQTQCADGIDNDTDGFIDLADPGCQDAADNDELNAALLQCNDGIDNDSDGKIDLSDPGCTSATDNDESDGAAIACSDGIDNDSDGKTDWPTDPGCSSISDTDETDTALPQCNDGIDNDGDGKSDYPTDPGCTSATDDDETDAPAQNKAPVVSAGSDQSITLPAKATLSGTASDDGLPSGSNLTSTWSKVSGPGTVTFTNKNAVNTNASFSVAGNYTLRLTATDGVLSTSDDVVITVAAAPSVNKKPTVNAGTDIATTLPAGASLNGNATDDGLPSGSTLATTWSMVSGPGTVTFANKNALQTQVTFSVVGTYVLRLTASDSSLSASDDVSVVVTVPPPVNQAPVVNAGADQTVTLPAPITLNGTASDDSLPAGSTLTASWGVISGPANVFFGSPTSLTTAVSFIVPGMYVLVLEVMDGDKSTTDEVTVTVLDPLQTTNPLLYIKPMTQTVKKGDRVTVTIEALNMVDLYSYLYTIGYDPSILAVEQVIGRGNLLTQNDTTATQYTDPNISSPGLIRSVSEKRLGIGPGVNGSGTLTTIIFTALKDGTSAITLQDVKLMNSISVLMNSALLSGRVIVGQGAGGLNAAPVVNAGTDQTVSSGLVATIVGTVTDDGLPSGGTLTSIWSIVSGPSTGTIANATSLSTSATFSLPGTYALRLTAFDGGMTVSDDVSITFGTVPPLQPGKLVVTVPLQTRDTNTISDAGTHRASVIVRIYEQGTKKKVLEQSVQTDDNGVTPLIDITSLAVGTKYDVIVKAKYFLASLLRNVTILSTGTTAVMPLSLGGDISGSGTDWNDGGDCSVNNVDLSEVKLNWGKRNNPADIDFNTTVGAEDFSIVKANLGKLCPLL